MVISQMPYKAVPEQARNFLANIFSKQVFRQQFLPCKKENEFRFVDKTVHGK